MSGSNKKEKNAKNIAAKEKELKNLSKEEKVKRLRGLRQKYPTRTSVDIYDYDSDILDVELIVLYLLLLDEDIISEMDDIIDETMEEEIESEPEAAVISEEITSDSGSDYGSGDFGSGWDF